MVYSHTDNNKFLEWHNDFLFIIILLNVLLVQFVFFARQ